MKVEIFFFSHKEFSNGKKIADPKGSRKIFFSRKKIVLMNSLLLVKVEKIVSYLPAVSNCLPWSSNPCVISCPITHPMAP